MTNTRVPFELPLSVKSFYDYFKISQPPKRVVEALGYGFEIDDVALPQVSEPPVWITDLDRRLRWSLLNVGMSSETARRETLVAPVLLSVAEHVGAPLEIEYPIHVSEQLHGDLDYFLTKKAGILVVEAKHGDPTRGTT